MFRDKILFVCIKFIALNTILYMGNRFDRHICKYFTCTLVALVNLAPPNKNHIGPASGSIFS